MSQSPERPRTRPRTLPGWFQDFGMGGVLLLLVVWFSWATWREDIPTGASAGFQLARRIDQPGQARVVVVGRDVPEDHALAEAFATELTRLGRPPVAILLGEPRTARVGLEGVPAAEQPLTHLVITPECAAWTVLTEFNDRFPQLGKPLQLQPTAERWPVFLTRQNLLNVANQIAVVAILAVGLTFVILTGGIDLSVGSLVALSAVVAAWLIRERLGGVAAGPMALLLAAAAAVGVCALLGLASGALVVACRIPPFITTLAVMQIASGLAFLLARGQSIYEVPADSTWLGRGTGWFGLPHAVALMLAVFAGAHVLLRRTVLGRHLYAVGGNEAAARLSGVRVGRVLLFAYAASGALAGLGGVVLASQLRSGAPTYGVNYELYAIAAVVVGGASLNGGRGHVLGTLIGALIIAVIQNGMNLTGVESYTQKVVLGLVILGAVLADRWKLRLSGR
jgi:ribose transport system permease protein